MATPRTWHLQNWTGRVDHVNARYRRIYNARDEAVARVYDPDHAAAVASVPELLRMTVRIANGETVTPAEAGVIARKCGVA